MHQHDELIRGFCECGDGPFTQETWDDHRMMLLGELPITVEERQLLSAFDSRYTSDSYRLVIEDKLTSRATGR